MQFSLWYFYDQGPYSIILSLLDIAHLTYAANDIRLYAHGSALILSSQVAESRAEAFLFYFLSLFLRPHLFTAYGSPGPGTECEPQL